METKGPCLEQESDQWQSVRCARGHFDRVVCRRLVVSFRADLFGSFPELFFVAFAEASE